MIKVDSLELPDSMRGEAFKLVATGAGKYELYDGEGSFLLRGTVGKTASLALPDGNSLSLFVSDLQGEDGQAFWVWRQLAARAPSSRCRAGSASPSAASGPASSRSASKAQTRRASSSRSTRSPTSTCARTWSGNRPRRRRPSSSSTSSCRSCARTWRRRSSRSIPTASRKARSTCRSRRRRSCRPSSPSRRS